MDQISIFFHRLNSVNCCGIDNNNCLSISIYKKRWSIHPFKMDHFWHIKYYFMHESKVSDRLLLFLSLSTLQKIKKGNDTKQKLIRQPLDRIVKVLLASLRYRFRTTPLHTPAEPHVGFSLSLRATLRFVTAQYVGQLRGISRHLVIYSRVGL